MSINRWMDGVMVCIYNGIYSAIKRNEIESVIVKWINLQFFIQSEVNQKEKNKHCNVNTYVWNLQKWY